MPHPDRRLLAIAALALLALVAFFVGPPIAQDPVYHRFADTAPLLGVPNFLNVSSNLPFALVGLLGLSRLRRLNAHRSARPAWATFFAGVLLVALGSGYYHLAPDDASLVWDRLPMTLAFVALTVAILTEWAAPRLARLLLPGLALGLGSVLVWVQTGDLRLYFGVQLMPMVVAVSALALYRAPFTRTRHLALAVACYALAKLVEALDHPIYDATNFVGGHPLKHLFAAAATWFVLDMLTRRQARAESGRA